MDTRPSPSPAASARSKPVASSSTSNNPSIRQQTSMPQSQTTTPPPLASVASSSKPARRPSISAGSSSGKAIDKQDKPARSSSNLSLKQKTSKKLDEPTIPNKNDELVKSYAADFDTLRNIITCKICDRLLYEPYVISCGHIYCYSCLSQWFVNNKKRKTCPDCRTVITQMPAPAYLIREMTTVFMNRIEHLPAGETIDVHQKWQKEEADIVQADRENTDRKTGGLFKGVFRTLPHRTHNAPIQDFEDMVERCPECAWELEEGICIRCGYQAGEAGWEDSIESFSDLDHSEMGGSSEDLDGDVDIEDYDENAQFPAFDPLEDIDAFQDQWDGGYGNEHSYAVRRWLHGRMNAAGPVAAAGLPPRRRAAHSIEGSRHRYSASITSDMLTEDMEMEALEEEDEDDLDEDSSMNDFIDDDNGTEIGSEVSTSTDSQTPQPAPAGVVTSQTARRGRNLRVVESESPSPSPSRGVNTPNGTAPDDEDDDEEGGPIRPGRHRRHQRMLARANGSFRATSSTSTENSADHELDEDTQHLLLHEQGWSPLAHEGPEEGMEEVDDESDGGRTTVGWEPTANSNTRPRMSNSLTPTAGRPSTQTRPRSRVGHSRILDGSRGLRRRSSVLSVSTVQADGGEADDDDSEIDRDGDTNMNSSQLRPRTSRIRLRGSQGTSRFAVPGAWGDEESDENSDDTSIQSPRRRQAGRTRQEYDPRISWMFAQHQTNMQAAVNQFEWLEELRSNTPIARPRTANRNRVAQSTTPTPFSPLSNNINPLAAAMNISPRARRTPIDTGLVQASLSAEPSIRSSRSGSVASNLVGSGTNSLDNGVRLNRGISADSMASNATVPSLARPVQERPSSQHSVSSISQSVTSGPSDIIERPASRLPARPPSANSRRGSQGLIGNYQGIQMSPGVGLNYAQRTFQTQTRNPYSAFIPVHAGNFLRPRQSTQRLREQSSTATLRASASRRVLRPQPSRGDVDDVVPVVRTQRSRVALRNQPSAQRLQSQPSMRALRPNEGAQLNHSQAAAVNTNGIAGARSPGNVASRLSEEERRRRASELIRTRARELSTTNPFAANGRRPSISGSSTAQAPTISYGTARPSISDSNSNASSSTIGGNAQSVTSSQGPPSSPVISRRRSARNMGLPPGAFPTHHNGVQAPMSTRTGRLQGHGVDGGSFLSNQRVPIATNYGV